MKRTVIIYDNYIEISRKAERLFIQTSKGKSSIPLSNIDGILIFGKASLTSDAISLCAKNQIPILLFTTYGKMKAQIIPPADSQTVNKRVKQVKLYFFKRLDVAKYFVKRKCIEIEYVFDEDLVELKLKIEKINDYNPLLGLEGQATRIMFQRFEEMIKDTGFKFTDRNYHPPKDEVNALLSFVYTLGYNLATGLIILKGYDPFISFLHSRRGKHAAFASDLMEVLRPHLTQLCADLILNKLIIKDDFNKERDYLVLKKSAIYKIIEEFNKFKNEFVDLMKEVLIDFENF